MRARQMVIPRNDKVLDRCGAQQYFSLRSRVCVCVMCVRVLLPVVVGEAWPPVGRPEQGLQGTGQVHKQVAHQEEPVETESYSWSLTGEKPIPRTATGQSAGTLPNRWDSHGEDGSDQVQGGDEDPQLCYQSRQQQSPGGLTVSFPMSKHLEPNTQRKNTITPRMSYRKRLKKLFKRSLVKEKPASVFLG